MHWLYILSIREFFYITPTPQINNHQPLNWKKHLATMPAIRRKEAAPVAPNIAVKIAPKIARKGAPKPAPRFKLNFVMVSEEVYGNTRRAIFKSTSLTGLWYAETKVPGKGSDESEPGLRVNPNPWTWSSPPRKIDMEKARARYVVAEMTSAKYRNKTNMCYKEMDFLRYHNELFGRHNWIKDIVAREITNCEILRKNPHPNICRYQGVNYEKETGAITGLLFDRYDMNLSDVVKQNRSFNATKCLSSIRKGIEHLHSLGLVHCDLKPANIFVDIHAHRFVVGDFDSVHKEGTVLQIKCGTPGWCMEEEETQGRALYECDRYAFEMIEEWIKKMGNGNPVQGRKYPPTYGTNGILDAAMKRKKQAKKMEKEKEEAKKKVALTKDLEQLKKDVKRAEEAVAGAKKPDTKQVKKLDNAKDDMAVVKVLIMMLIIISLLILKLVA
jgi:serine/threonine protein kinase